MNQTTKSSNTIKPAYIAMAFLLIALLPGLPYGYFQVLRIIVCGIACYGASLAYSQKRHRWLWAMIPIGIVFNPIMPIWLDRSHWVVIDFVCAMIFMKSTSLFNSDPKEREYLLKELGVSKQYYHSLSFSLIEQIIEPAIKSDYTKITDIINKIEGGTAKEWMHSQIGNIAGDLLESGNFHIYRGTLNNIGQELLNIFDKSYDVLIEMQTPRVTAEYAATQKKTLRDCISAMG